ncbi:PREDICTED: uncharacterized protein LOC104814026 [Tarenaya hassleriana]|uniref:uncharacterized protein LOC104814026 n=1 Tax=Tarenaya hassleriana TaxID=28532 RepID=UPI00053C23EC|nr:PREDICTED: uncharacterized protein LOC104814026 [Tarenaya hassleriana]
MAFPVKPTFLFFLLYSLVNITSTAFSLAQNHGVLSQDKPSDNINGLRDKVSLEINNVLGDGIWLEFHCKSKNDDLGYKILRPNESWSFRFRPNFWGTTLFFCRFWWKGDSHWFDIYDDGRENPFSDWTDSLIWRVRKTGPCRMNQDTKIFDICYDWNKA